MNEVPQVDAVMVVPEGDAVKTFPLSLDSMCLIGAALAQAGENLSENGMILELAKAGAEAAGESEEWGKFKESYDKAFSQWESASREFIAIHDAMHDGENVHVVVVPF